MEYYLYIYIYSIIVSPKKANEYPIIIHYTMYLHLYVHLNQVSHIWKNGISPLIMECITLQYSIPLYPLIYIYH